MSDDKLHLDAVEALEDIARSLDKEVAPPEVNVTVEAPNISIPETRVQYPEITPVGYKFTVERDSRGLIEVIYAEPMDG